MVMKMDTAFFILLFVSGSNLLVAQTSTLVCLQGTLDCFKPVFTALGVQFNSNFTTVDLAKLGERLLHIKQRDLCKNIKDLNFDHMSDCYVNELKKCIGSNQDTSLYEALKKSAAAYKYVCTPECEKVDENYKTVADCAVKFAQHLGTLYSETDAQKRETCQDMKDAVNCMWDAAGNCRYLTGNIEASVSVLQKSINPLMKPVKCDLPISSVSGLRTPLTLIGMLVAVLLTNYLLG